jgi:release factor glutamine methyltransferase
MDEPLTLAALLAEGVRQLREGAGATDSPLTAALDARVLLTHVVALPQSRLTSHPEALIDPSPVRAYRELLKRRAAGEPLAYLTGVKEFWSLDLLVTPAVLIPRPETELLVERALALGGVSARVADFGTGSGAVALALASERPDWQITATDLSEAALNVARANAARLKLQSLEFCLGNWFEPLAGRTFDLILSNPPYVDAADPALSHPALTYEPRQALTPGFDGLAALRLLAQGAPEHLSRGGWLLLEHGTDQGSAVRDALVKAGFAHVRSHRDLGGHERMTEGQHGQI